MCEDFAACHWVRLSETLLCAPDDCWSARQLLLNRAYCRDRNEARRAERRPQDENEVSTSDNEVKAAENEVSTSDNEVKAAENEVSTSDNEVKAAENQAEEVEVPENEVSTSENEVKAASCGKEVKVAENGVSTSENEVKVSEDEAVSCGKEVKIPENEVSTSENEVKVTENEVSTSENEVKAASCGKEVKVAENGVSTSENEVRVSGKKAKGVQNAVRTSLKAVDVIENEVQTTLKELQAIENQVERLERTAESEAHSEVQRLATKVKALESQCKASETRVRLLEGQVKALQSQVAEADKEAEADNEAEAVLQTTGDAQLSLSSGEEEAALMRALGLPTAFGRPEDSSGDASDAETRKRPRKRAHRAASGPGEQQRLEAGDKALRRRFEKFWKDEGAGLKYAAFVQTYGRLLGADFWRSVPASVTRDPYVAQLMAEAEEEEEAEFEWEAAWPQFVMQLRQRWFLWFLHENRDPGEAQNAAQRWRQQLADLGCSCDLAQPGALQPLVLHAKTNRVAASHARLSGQPQRHEEEPGHDLSKYWAQRYRLFSRWDDGVQLDRESWFSVTPEKIAQHHAQRLSNAAVIVDAFCGAGGNTIQFARYCDTVIAVDIDPAKLALAAHNAAVYGVSDRVHFVCADFFRLSLRLPPATTALFLSPPWGGPAYLQHDVFDLSDLGGMSCQRLLATARDLTPNVALFVPRNSNVAQLVGVGRPGEMVEVEQNFLNNKLKAITAYFGDLVDHVTESY